MAIISEQKRREIWAAADELNEQGVSVTMNNIKEHMGGGSFTYISPVLREWKAAQKPKFTISNVDLPEDLKKEAGVMTTNLMGSFKEVAWTLAEEKIEQGIADANARLEDMGLHVRELEEGNEELEAAKQSLSTENQSMREMISSLQTETSEKSQHLSSLENQLNQTKEFLNASDNALKDLQREHKTQGELYDQAQQKLSEQQTLIDDLKAQLSGNQAELSKALEQTSSQQKLLETNQGTIKALQADKDQAQKTQQEQKDIYEAQLKELEKNHEVLKTHYDRSSSQINTLEGQLTGKDQRIEELVKVEVSYLNAQEQLRKSSIEAGELKKENKKLQSECGRLSGLLADNGELTELREFKDKAFEAHPNIDADIDNLNS